MSDERSGEAREARSGGAATHAFRATLEIVGVNPYVDVPEEILRAVFDAAGKDRGPIPVRGTVQGAPYTQTLVRFAGRWRLYVNTKMLRDSPKRVGEAFDFTVGFDPRDRSLGVPPALARALDDDPRAREVFEGLPPSRRLEIVRYLANLRSEDALRRNVTRAIRFLRGEARFVGRDTPR